MNHSRIVPESFPNRSGLTRAWARARRGALETGDRRQDWNASLKVGRQVTAVDARGRANRPAGGIR